MPSAPESARPSVKAILSATLLVPLLAGALVALYGAVNRWLLSAGGASWLPAALVHTAMATGVASIAWRAWRRTGTVPWTPAGGPVALFRQRPLILWLPAIIVLTGSLLLAVASAGLIPADGPPAGQAGPPSLVLAQWAWILWIPVVEETVFRGGFGPAFRRLAGPVWGCWFSALVFAIVHTDFQPAAVLAGRVGLPVGPFLLGLAAEALILTGGRLLPVILLHAACNLTPVIFALIDPRWLGWIGFLYGQVPIGGD